MKVMIVFSVRSRILLLLSVAVKAKALSVVSTVSVAAYEDGFRLDIVVVALVTHAPGIVLTHLVAAARVFASAHLLGAIIYEVMDL